MDYEVIQIEKYFLENRDPKHLKKNIDNLTSKELQEIVTPFNPSLKRATSQPEKQKKNYLKK
jgi:hypothetical protein